MEKKPYDDRLEYLKLMRLDTRRERSDLIETCKIINNNYNIGTDLFFQFDDSGRRGHCKKLFKRRFKLDVRKYVFSNRVVDKWNSLPDNCVTNLLAIHYQHLNLTLQPNWNRKGKGKCLFR